MVWPKRVGDYIISSFLGQGSFGDVRRGTHIYSQTPSAVKILQYNACDFDEYSQDIRREMSILMAIQHPFIISLYDVVYRKKKLYLVMELAESDLDKHIRSHVHLSEHLARRYFRQLIDALLHCHAHGIFHRDIKPENLLLTNNRTVLKVADFGFAAVVNVYSSAHTLMRTACGSRPYCAPEVLRGLGYDGALADAYSCGAVLCAMLVGVDWICKGFDHEAHDFPEHVSDSAKDLIKNLMQPDVGKRTTLAEARNCPWLTMEESNESQRVLRETEEVDWFSLTLCT